LVRNQVVEVRQARQKCLSGQKIQTAHLPGLSRVALLWTSANPAHTLMLREAQEAAQGLGVQTQLLDVRDASALDGAFAAMVQARAEALVVLNVDHIACRFPWGAS